jgi:hypothetical protein
MTDKNQRDHFSSAGANRYGRNQTRMQNENTDPYEESYLVGDAEGTLDENRKQSNRPPRIPVDGAQPADVKAASVISASVTERLFKTKGVYPKHMQSNTITSMQIDQTKVIDYIFITLC